MLVAGALEGWWRQPLAPAGDTRAFMDAAVAEIDRTRRGNVAFVLIEDGQVFDEHFTSAGQPVDRDTLFQVASMSKWITAWGVMTLVEAGTLDLDAPVSTYLTRWSLPTTEFDNDGVTVRRLLSHTAGLTDGLGYGGFAPGQPVAATRGVPDPCGRRVARCRRGGSRRYRAGKRLRVLGRRLYAAAADHRGSLRTILQRLYEERRVRAARHDAIDLQPGGRRPRPTSRSSTTSMERRRFTIASPRSPRHRSIRRPPT